MYAYAFALMIVAVAAYFLWRAVKKTPPDAADTQAVPEDRSMDGGPGPGTPR